MIKLKIPSTTWIPHSLTLLKIYLHNLVIDTDILRTCEFVIVTRKSFINNTAAMGYLTIILRVSKAQLTDIKYDQPPKSTQQKISGASN